MLLSLSFFSLKFYIAIFASMLFDNDLAISLGVNFDISLPLYTSIKYLNVFIINC